MQSGNNIMPAQQDLLQIMPAQQDLLQKFGAALESVNDILLKNYLLHLKEFEVLPFEKKDIAAIPSKDVRLFKITKMVYEKDEYALHKFESVFSSISETASSLFVIIDGNKDTTDFYMGVRGDDPVRTTHSIYDTLKKSFRGHFPGTSLEEEYDAKKISTLVQRIQRRDKSIASVSCIPGPKDDSIRENRTFLQGLEKLAIAMQGEEYTGILLANTSDRAQLAMLRQEYEKLYTDLCPFASLQLNLGKNESLSFAFSESETKSQSTTISQPLKSIFAQAATSAVGIISKVLAPATGGISTQAGIVVSAILAPAIKPTKTETDSQSETKTKTRQKGSSHAMTFTLTDKYLQNTLERLEEQIQRLQEFESLSMWEFAAYFLADDTALAETAAATYKAMVTGEHSGVEISALNTWLSNAEPDKTNMLRTYISNFEHPLFIYRHFGGADNVAPANYVSGRELAFAMGLPRNSVAGFPVVEHSAFGKEIVQYAPEKTEGHLELGHIFNMGSEQRNTVTLNKESLSMHTFITGSTGSGKSNTVYEILHQLDKSGVRFLIVEPAKGEYKNIFSHNKNVNFYGTNPKLAPLLRINPFRFPQGIHVLEHIDRLSEIFNVCWPMYAAMPAILKDALLQSYESCGWNLTTSKNEYSEDLFPTFSDLLDELVAVIEQSAYSDELKSNYIGSLVTRVKSLTNGLNGQLFSADELDNNILFDQNTLIDLSRVFSTETKALIMGVLIMRLNEHRIAFSEGMNVPLRHVTVLEEAHNILRRTSGNEQSAESPSLAAKSVELLSNSIAEMRTYGEGFIIADQSPSAVDFSAIRNTNTKIIMRLPDESDRRFAGKAAALKDEQLDEIAKLPRGVAVVYQNNWLEPVLCKIKKCGLKEEPYHYNHEEVSKETPSLNFKIEFVKLLLKGRSLEPITPEIDFLRQNLTAAELPTKYKLALDVLLKEYKEKQRLEIWQNSNFHTLAKMVTDLFCNRNRIVNCVTAADDFLVLNAEMNAIIDSQAAGLSDEFKLHIRHCFMREYYRDKPENIKIYAAWRKSVERGM
ncbi:ATP-binding protein [Synergistaceae bacterium OttesenSCG-928-D05]|nr:ATP-binding protein [Synergistaceae bacterium OttesenSCG-928-D05]